MQNTGISDSSVQQHNWTCPVTTQKETRKQAFPSFPFPRYILSPFKQSSSFIHTWTSKVVAEDASLDYNLHFNFLNVYACRAHDSRWNIRQQCTFLIIQKGTCTHKKWTHLLHSFICQKCKFNRQTLQGLFQSPPRAVIQSSPGRKRCSVWAQSTRRTELMIKFRKQTPLGRCTSLQKAVQDFKELTVQRYYCSHRHCQVYTGRRDNIISTWVSKYCYFCWPMECSTSFLFFI